MAKSRRRNTTAYSTYGSVAYAPAYDGNAVRAPRREEELRRAPRPKQREQVRRHERARVEVRKAGKVSLFAVVGFIMLVASYAQLSVANDEMVALQRELSELQSQNTILTAQYEKVFDLATIQEAVGDTMVRPTTDQVVYIDLSAPDTVTLYQEESLDAGIQSLVSGIQNLFSGIIEYFR